MFAISHVRINTLCINIELRRCVAGAVIVPATDVTAACLLDKWQHGIFSCCFVLIVPFVFSPAHPACIPGTFKSKFGEGTCAACPSNSRTSARGANICPCQNGFYRADSDPPDSGCTSKSASTAQTTKASSRFLNRAVEVTYSIYP